MTYDYDRSQRKYRDDQGNEVSRQELRGLINDLLDSVRSDAGKLAAKYDADEITATEFKEAMRELLKSAHIVASSVGRGGLDMMTASDWGRVGAKIQWQYKYLDKFARKLESLSKANSSSRARSYVSAVYVSYADSYQQSQMEKLEPDGKVVTDENMLCRLVQNSKEGCEECTADAAEGWIPVSEMGEIGTRICGDFCECEIEFEDEIVEA